MRFKRFLCVRAYIVYVCTQENEQTYSIYKWELWAFKCSWYFLGGCSILYRLQIAPTSLLRHFFAALHTFLEEFTKCSNPKYLSPPYISDYFSILLKFSSRYIFLTNFWIYPNILSSHHLIARFLAFWLKLFIKIKKQ